MAATMPVTDDELQAWVRAHVEIGCNVHVDDVMTVFKREHRLAAMPRGMRWRLHTALIMVGFELNPTDARLNSERSVWGITLSRPMPRAPRRRGAGHTAR